MCGGGWFASLNRTEPARSPWHHQQRAAQMESGRCGTAVMIEHCEHHDRATGASSGRRRPLDFGTSRAAGNARTHAAAGLAADHPQLPGPSVDHDQLPTEKGRPARCGS